MIVCFKFALVRNEECLNESLVKLSNLFDLPSCSIKVISSLFFQIWSISFNVFLNNFFHFDQLVIFVFLVTIGLCENYMIWCDFIGKLSHQIQQIVWIISQIQISFMINSSGFKFGDIFVNKSAVMNKSDGFVKFHKSV